MFSYFLSFREKNDPKKQTGPSRDEEIETCQCSEPIFTQDPSVKEALSAQVLPDESHPASGQQSPTGNPAAVAGAMSANSSDGRLGGGEEPRMRDLMNRFAVLDDDSAESGTLNLFDPKGTLPGPFAYDGMTKSRWKTHGDVYSEVYNKEEPYPDDDVQKFLCNRRVVNPKRLEAEGNYRRDLLSSVPVNRDINEMQHPSSADAFGGGSSPRQAEEPVQQGRDALHSRVFSGLDAGRSQTGSFTPDARDYYIAQQSSRGYDRRNVRCSPSAESEITLRSFHDFSEPVLRRHQEDPRKTVFSYDESQRTAVNSENYTPTEHRHSGTRPHLNDRYQPSAQYSALYNPDDPRGHRGDHSRQQHDDGSRIPTQSTPGVLNPEDTRRLCHHGGSTNYDWRNQQDNNPHQPPQCDPDLMEQKLRHESVQFPASHRRGPSKERMRRRSRVASVHRSTRQRHPTVVSATNNTTNRPRRRSERRRVRFECDDNQKVGDTHQKEPGLSESNVHNAHEPCPSVTVDSTDDTTQSTSDGSTAVQGQRLLGMYDSLEFRAMLASLEMRARLEKVAKENNRLKKIADKREKQLAKERAKNKVSPITRAEEGRDAVSRDGVSRQAFRESIIRPASNTVNTDKRHGLNTEDGISTHAARGHIRDSIDDVPHRMTPSQQFGQSARRLSSDGANGEHLDSIGCQQHPKRRSPTPNSMSQRCTKHESAGRSQGQLRLIPEPTEGQLHETMLPRPHQWSTRWKSLQDVPEFQSKHSMNSGSGDAGTARDHDQIQKRTMMCSPPAEYLVYRCQESEPSPQLGSIEETERKYTSEARSSWKAAAASKRNGGGGLAFEGHLDADLETAEEQEDTLKSEDLSFKLVTEKGDSNKWIKITQQSDDNFQEHEQKQPIDTGSSGGEYGEPMEGADNSGPNTYNINGNMDNLALQEGSLHIPETHLLQEPAQQLTAVRDEDILDQPRGLNDHDFYPAEEKLSGQALQEYLKDMEKVAQSRSVEEMVKEERTKMGGRVGRPEAHSQEVFQNQRRRSSHADEENEIENIAVDGSDLLDLEDHGQVSDRYLEVTEPNTLQDGAKPSGYHENAGYPHEDELIGTGAGEHNMDMIPTDEADERTENPTISSFFSDKASPGSGKEHPGECVQQEMRALEEDTHQSQYYKPADPIKGDEDDVYKCSYVDAEPEAGNEEAGVETSESRSQTSANMRTESFHLEDPTDGIKVDMQGGNTTDLDQGGKGRKPKLSKEEATRLRTFFNIVVASHRALCPKTTSSAHEPKATSSAKNAAEVSAQKSSGTTTVIILAKKVNKVQAPVEASNESQQKPTVLISEQKNKGMDPSAQEVQQQGDLEACNGGSKGLPTALQSNKVKERGTKQHTRMVSEKKTQPEDINKLLGSLNKPEILVVNASGAVSKVQASSVQLKVKKRHQC